MAQDVGERPRKDDPYKRHIRSGPHDWPDQRIATSCKTATTFSPHACRRSDVATELPQGKRDRILYGDLPNRLSGRDHGQTPVKLSQVTRWRAYRDLELPSVLSLQKCQIIFLFCLDGGAMIMESQPCIGARDTDSLPGNSVFRTVSSFCKVGVSPGVST